MEAVGPLSGGGKGPALSALLLEAVCDEDSCDKDAEEIAPGAFLLPRARDEELKSTVVFKMITPPQKITTLLFFGWGNLYPRLSLPQKIIAQLFVNGVIKT